MGEKTKACSHVCIRVSIASIEHAAQEYWAAQLLLFLIDHKGEWCVLGCIRLYQAVFPPQKNL